jgi:hypothetical protein
MNINEVRTVGDLYPRKWLKPEHLGGRKVTVKISEVGVQEFHQPDGTLKPAPVLSFEHAQRKLILNKSQCTALALLLGSGAFSDWVGRTVVLSAATATNGKPTIAVLAAETHEPMTANEEAER